MKKLLFALTIGISLSTISCSNNTGKPEQNEQGITVVAKDVNAEEFAQLIRSNEGQILDVRTPEEWAEGIIKGATKMNFYDDNFKDQLNQLDKSKAVYVYCKSGGRSGQATKMMKEMGFTEVYNLLGGMVAWKSQGMETLQ